jgi:Tfp pilus assembly protein PilV
MPPRARQGFTLLESLIASAILFAGVLAVISAIMSGQKKAFEAEQQVLATLTAEELMGAIVADDYFFLEPTWAGNPPTESFFAWVTVDWQPMDASPIGVVVDGKLVTVSIRASMTEPRVLAELEQFIPAPQ